MCSNEISNLIESIQKASDELNNLKVDQPDDEIVTTTISGEERITKTENGYVTQTIIDAAVQGTNGDEFVNFNQHVESNILFEI